MPTHDGRALLVHTDIDKTYASIARFSERDAETFREKQEAYTDFYDTIVMPALFSPPSDPSEQIHALETTPEGLEFLRLSRMSPRDVVREWFEDEHVQAMILHQLPVPRGIVDDYYGLGHTVPLVVTQIEQSQLCIGGSHVLAHALWRALQRNGGAVKSMAHVSRILVENGRAVGVRLSDDTEIRADKAVVSAIDIKQTFLDMVGEDDLEPAFVEQVKNYRLDEFSIFGVHLALKEAPRFTAAADDPDINQAFKINIGCETPADFARVWAEIRAGELPHRPGMYCSIPTLYDQSQAPAGQHTAIIWQLAPYELRDGGAEAWDRIKDDYADECIAHWATYAPNLTSDNVMMRVAYSPLDIERKLINMRRGGVFGGRVSFDQIEYFRPLPTLANYRSPIESLYLAGATCRPGGGIIGAPGYIAASVICDDLGVKKWWG